MVRNRNGVVISAALFCAIVNSGLANGFRNPPDGAAGLGRTGAKITEVNDASAISINPANLSGLTKAEVQGGAIFVDSTVEFRGADGRSEETDSSGAVIPSVFGAMPLDGNHALVLGVGLTSPWGQATEWPDDGLFTGTAPYLARLTTINLNPTVSGRLSKRVRVGAGVDLMQGELDLRQKIPLAPGAPLTHIRLNGDGTGLGGNAGITIDLPRQQHLSATYRSPVTIEFEGDTTVTGFTGPLVPGSDFETEIEFPAVAAVGYGFQVTPALRVGVEAEWVEFSRFDSLPLDLGVNSAPGLFPAEIPQQWDDVWCYGVGADWTLSDTWVLRAGCVYLESPIPEETLAPTLPDDDRLVYSTGCGYRKGPDALDLAYAYSTYDRTVDANANPAYLGSYDAEIHLLSVSYSRQF